MELKKITESVLGYPKLAARLVEHPADVKRAQKIVKEIRSRTSLTFMAVVEKFLESTFLRLYNGIFLETVPGLDIEALNKNNNIVLVPNHQSHADYIAITYIFYKKFRIGVHVAGGINLNVFPLGSLFRRCGCFFIRRSFASDILYKLVLEAYLYHLLKTGAMIEFYFEGGRSRSGKMLAPRYGLFQMIVEAHEELQRQGIAKPLLFMPISLSHEHLPEERSHVREITGGAKSEAKVSKLPRTFWRLLTGKFGSIYVRAAEGVAASEDTTDRKKQIQELAFNCFRSVGKGIAVTPTALLAMIFLDDPQGVLDKETLLAKAAGILEYCRHSGIPSSGFLGEDVMEFSLFRAMDVLISNKKVKVIDRPELGKTFYALHKESRPGLLYFKNTILHHFLVPSTIAKALSGVRSGRIKTTEHLKNFLLDQRARLKYEFYLPTTKDLYADAFHLISWCTGRKIERLEQVMLLDDREVEMIARVVDPFARGLAFIDEGHYLTTLVIRHFGKETFTREKFVRDAKAIFELERAYGRLIRYQESFSVPLLMNSLAYFEHLGVVERKPGGYMAQNPEQIAELMEKYAQDLTSLVTFNLKAATPF
jgi:glycerol-3-phosphate O-acyltransferase